MIFGILFGFISALASPELDQSPSQPSKCRTLLTNLIKRIEQQSTDSIKPWVLTHEQEKTIQVIFQNEGSDLLNIQRAMVALIFFRENNMNPLSRFFTRGASREIKYREKMPSLYNLSFGWLLGHIRGPHYNPVFNRIKNTLHRKAEKTKDPIVTLESFTADIHEFGHAADRNTAPFRWIVFWKLFFIDIFSAFLKTPVTPLLYHYAESVAIGAEWELYSRVPLEIRNQWQQNLKEKAQELKTKRLSERDEKIATKNRKRELENEPPLTDEEINFISGKEMTSEEIMIEISITAIEFSHLSKSEYILIVSKVHQYDLKNLLKDHYFGLSFFRILALHSFFFFNLMEALMSYETEWGNHKFGQDAYWIGNFLRWLF